LAFKDGKSQKKNMAFILSRIPLKYQVFKRHCSLVL